MNQTYAQQLVKAAVEAAVETCAWTDVEKLTGPYEYDDGERTLQAAAKAIRALDIDAIIASVPMPEPVYYSITVNGQHCGNFWPIEDDAIAAAKRLNASYPQDLRAVVPLFAAPVAQPSCKDCGKPTPPDSIHTCSPQYKQPAQDHQCRYPLCQSEAEQQRIADDVYRQLYSGEPAQRELSEDIASKLPVFVYFKEVHPGWPEYNQIDEFSSGKGGGEPLVKLSDVRAILIAKGAAE